MYKITMELELSCGKTCGGEEEISNIRYSSRNFFLTENAINII
jgi:hypothetical protein